MGAGGFVKTYLFSYPYQGHQYSLEIKAESREEAEGRFKAIPWGQYDGELQVTIPASTGDWVPRLICWMRNL
jgi:hypothetical protein